MAIVPIRDQGNREYAYRCHLSEANLDRVHLTSRTTPVLLIGSVDVGDTKGRRALRWQDNGSRKNRPVDLGARPVYERDWARTGSLGMGNNYWESRK